jgi:hypothetical protein
MYGKFAILNMNYEDIRRKTIPHINHPRAGAVGKGRGVAVVIVSIIRGHCSCGLLRRTTGGVPSVLAGEAYGARNGDCRGTEALIMVGMMMHTMENSTKRGVMPWI